MKEAFNLIEALGIQKAIIELWLEVGLVILLSIVDEIKHFLRNDSQIKIKWIRRSAKRCVDLVADKRKYGQSLILVRRVSC